MRRTAGTDVQLLMREQSNQPGLVLWQTLGVALAHPLVENHLPSACVGHAAAEPAPAGDEQRLRISEDGVGWGGAAGGSRAA